MLNTTPLIAFNHILKTGGTSLNYALEQSHQNYRRMDWYVVQNELNILQIQELIYTSDALGFHVTNRIFREQVLPLILNGMKNKEIFLITLIREPIQRIESLWRQQWHSNFLLGSLCPENQQPKDYYPSIDHYLSKVLEVGHEMIPQYLQLACYQSEYENLDSLVELVNNHYVGIATLEKFDKFFYYLQMLGIIDLCLTPKKKNVSPVDHMIQSQEIKTGLEQMLQLDYQLYYFLQENEGLWINPTLDF